MLSPSNPPVKTRKTLFWSHPSAPEFQVEYIDFYPQDPPIEIVGVYVHGTLIGDRAMPGLVKFGGLDMEILTEEVAKRIQRTPAID